MERDNSRFATGVLLVAISVFFFVSAYFSLANSREVDAAEPVAATGFHQISEVNADLVPTRIRIPKLKIDIPVQEAALVNGYWETFDDRAGWGVGSALPGQPGNEVIFAHARENLFLPIRWIRKGTEITVTNGHGEYIYEVVSTKTVKPSDTNVIAPTDDETLTLYTCSGFADSRRLIVTAKRI